MIDLINDEAVFLEEEASAAVDESGFGVNNCCNC